MPYFILFMTLPICNICAKTGILCGACESKLQEGKISKFDIELSRSLYDLGKGEIGFERAIDTENFIIVLAQKDSIGKIIGKGGDNIRLLSNKFGKQLRVVGIGDMDSTIYEFVAPARILGINTVYKQNGEIVRRVRINKKDKKKLRMGSDEIKKLIESLTNYTIELSFE